MSGRGLKKDELASTLTKYGVPRSLIAAVLTSVFPVAWGNLQFEFWLEIASFLPVACINRLKRTCHRLYQLKFEKTLRHINPWHVPNFFSNGPTALTSLWHVSHHPVPSSSAIPNLTYLSSTFTDPNWEVLLPKLPRLKGVCFEFTGDSPEPWLLPYITELLVLSDYPREWKGEMEKMVKLTTVEIRAHSKITNLPATVTDLIVTKDHDGWRTVFPPEDYAGGWRYECGHITFPHVTSLSVTKGTVHGLTFPKLRKLTIVKSGERVSLEGTFNNLVEVREENARDAHLMEKDFPSLKLAYLKAECETFRWAERVVEI